MSISKEEKQINRPLLYFTGGLVLGETMALWMTVGMECFGLAAMLLAFFVRDQRGTMKLGSLTGKRRGVLFVLGLLLGVGRMEFEEWTVRTEETLVQAWSKEEVSVTGEILEISETETGIRLLLGECREENDSDRERNGSLGDQAKGIRRMYCYVDSAEYEKIGMKVRVTGTAKVPDPDRNPGAFDYWLYCRSKGICGIFYGSRIEVLDGRYLALREWARNTGLLLERQLEQIAEAEELGILKAVLLGNKTEIEDDVYELYRKNGISHVLAISGLHVSVLGMGLWKGLRRLGIGYTLSGVLAFGFLFLYGSIAGFGTSVVRAVFMMGISFAAGVCGRTYDLPSAMCIPAVGLLLARPFLLTQASFQLSFLAVGAISFPGNYLAKKWGWDGFRKNLLVSTSIQVVTAPVILAHSFEIPVYSVLLNLVVVPLMTYVLVSGLVGTLLSFLEISLGTAALGGAHYILRFYEWLGRSAEQIPGAILVPGKPTLIAIAVFYVCLLAGVWLAGRRKKSGLMVCLVGVLFLFPVPESGLSITFLDVGQGDGIFLQAGNRTMLVDCGSSQEKEIGEDCLVPFLKSKGITRLDAVVVSHGDQDHVSGIRYLLENPNTGIEIGCLVMPDIGGEDEVLTEFEHLPMKRKIPVSYKKAGDRMDGVLGEDVRLKCLHPGENDGGEADRNEDSLVVLVEYGAFRLLLTGDVGVDGEKEILARESISPVTVLKAGHHGSDSSTSEEFLRELDPDYVVFSYGRGNRYGHPAEAVVERCQTSGAKIYETGKSGAIEVLTDGERVRVQGWLDRPGGI